MQAIKVLVIGMGVLLVAGLGLLGYGMYAKARKLAPEAPAHAAPFGEVAVRLPAGTRVEQMEAVAGRLALRVSDGTATRILVLDPGTGQVAGVFVLDGR